MGGLPRSRQRRPMKTESTSQPASVARKAGAGIPLCEQDAENPERKRGDGEPGELIPDHERSSLRAGRLQMLKMAARDMRMKPA